MLTNYTRLDAVNVRIRCPFAEGSEQPQASQVTPVKAAAERPALRHDLSLSTGFGSTVTLVDIAL
jgi:hypothetical protein